MTSILNISPAFPVKTPAEPPEAPIQKPYLMPDMSLEFLKFANGFVDFLEGAQDYWANKGLMEGYSEGVTLAANHLRDSLGDSNPLVQATVGSTVGVVKLMGAIPFGLGHWFHQSARDVFEKDLGAGFKTFISIPFEGFKGGAKFVLGQVKNWSQGQISPSTFGVAEEVSTTLGTAVLMFLGIKGMYRGGSGMIQGLENLELSQPALVTNAGRLLPASIASESIGGFSPMTEGLVYMSSTKKEDPANNRAEGQPCPKEPMDEGTIERTLDMLIREELLPTDNPYITLKSRQEWKRYGFRLSSRTQKLLLELENAPSGSKLALRFEVGSLLAGNGKYLLETHLEALSEIVWSLRKHKHNDLPKIQEQLNRHIAILTYALGHFPRSMRYALKNFDLTFLQKAAIEHPQIGELLLKIEAFTRSKP